MGTKSGAASCRPTGPLFGMLAKSAANRCARRALFVN